MKTGLLGYPIVHSLSPAIHNAAYKALGLDWHYGLNPCPDKESFDATLSEVLRDPASFVGLNITTPYKKAAFEACQEHLCDAEVAESANALVVCGMTASGLPGFIGDNTDGRGLIMSLEQQTGITMSDSTVVICGTGSVAMSTLLQLLRKQTAEVYVVSRDAQLAKKRVDALCERYIRSMGKNRLDEVAVPKVQVIDYSGVAPILNGTNVLIDTTTLGMNASDEAVVPLELLRPGMMVYDVVYGHGETALIKGARQRGAKAFDGLGMLIEQAALSIEIWAHYQGLELIAPRELMREAATTELSKR